MSNRTGLTVSLLLMLALCFVLFDDCIIGAQDVWTQEEVVVARHCVSERSFARSGDCRVVAWIDKRNADRRHLPLLEWMAQAHSTHLRSRSRPWIAQLDAAGTRPASWPENVQWDGAREEWFRTLAVVRDVLNGGDHGCDGFPLTWGSPTVDRPRLDRWYAHGFDRLRCGGAPGEGNGTRNEVVGRRAR